MQKLLTKRNVLFLLFIFTFFAAWNRGINLLYIMWALLGATIILAYLLPKLSLKGLNASRKVQAVAFEGEILDVRLRLDNRGWRSRHMIEVFDSIPSAPPEVRCPMTFVGNLPGRASREFVMKIPCYKRGMYRIGPLSLESSYPLGISSAKKEISNETTSLLVYPEVFDVANIPILSASYLPFSGVEALSKAGVGEEFFGTREYRRGDSLRHIHWPSTARHGRMIVKEFETRRSTEITIVLDLHKGACIGKEKESTHEYAVKIAASISKYAIGRSHKVQLIGYGKKPLIIPGLGGFAHFSEILESLARVEADGQIDYPVALDQAAGLIDDGTIALLFFSAFQKKDDRTIQALELLLAKRVRPIGVFFDRESFLDSESGKTSNQIEFADRLLYLGLPPYWIRKGDNLREKFI